MGASGFGGSGRHGGGDHQQMSIDLIHRCLTSVDSLYANIQGFNPGDDATAAARRANKVRACMGSTL